MKMIKKLFSLAVATAVFLSIAVLPASARSVYADSIWTGRIAGFKKLSIATGKSQPGYTKVLQMFMVGYSEIFSDDIYMHGGIDGDFGNAVKRCVVEFQSVEGITEYQNGTELEPGTVAYNTWWEIGDQMWDEMYYTDPDSGEGFIIFGDSICRSTLTYPYVFEYAYLADGDTAWEYFHTAYA